MIIKGATATISMEQYSALLRLLWSIKFADSMPDDNELRDFARFFDVEEQ